MELQWKIATRTHFSLRPKTAKYQYVHQEGEKLYPSLFSINRLRESKGYYKH